MTLRVRAAPAAIAALLALGTAAYAGQDEVAAKRVRMAAASCSSAIGWDRARNHLGETRTVRGPVRSTKYAAGSRGQPTFLNIGRAYPDQRRVQVIIFGQYRGSWRQAPEIAYRGKTIAVRGRVKLYRGVVEIAVTTPQDISVCR